MFTRMLQMPQSLTSHNLAHPRHFSSIYPIYDALRRSKICASVKGDDAGSWVADPENCGGGRQLFSAPTIKWALPKFPTQWQAAGDTPWKLTLFLVTNRVWKQLDILWVFQECQEAVLPRKRQQRTSQNIFPLSLNLQNLNRIDPICSFQTLPLIFCPCQQRFVTLSNFT